MRYSFTGSLDTIENQITQRQQQLNRLASTADNFVSVQDMHTRKLYELQNHNKELLENNNVATIFDFLRSINRGNAYTAMNFAFRDSVRNNDHGIVRVRLDGSGTYRAFFNFLMVLEQSKPITRVTDVRMAPAGQDFASLNRVNYEMNVDFYYARGTTRTDPDLLINTSVPPRLYNPFYALVHQVPPNTDGLVNVDDSRLVGLVRAGAYIIDQNNEMRFVPVGSRVYLGTLQSVNMNERTAAFRLNRGGIRDVVVMRIDRAE